LQRHEAEFIAGCLHRLLCLLDAIKTPELLVLVALRIDLSLGQEALFQRLRGGKIFDKAAYIENFCQPEHIRHYTLDEIMGT
jgi:hypothetical protein